LQVVTWGEYVESICCRFGGKKDRSTIRA